MACQDACSLNGVCQNGACVCDRGWRGAMCEQLDVRETTSQLHGENASCELTHAHGSDTHSRWSRIVRPGPSCV